VRAETPLRRPGMVKPLSKAVNGMKTTWTLSLLISILALNPESFAGADIQTKRPAQWAQPVIMDGVPNLYRVSDDLYRSAQPTAGGMRSLKKAGIKTIVSLRSFHSDRDEIGETGLGYEHIDMKAWHPEEEEIVRFLRVVTRHERTPVLVHCEYGADRTGTVCAIFRILIQGWSKEEAVREMSEGGFGFHGVWTNLKQWITHLDLGRIKKQAGIP
jgi:protein tyrosine phosphatase (PTP) superfamily phosphohydrolase (DUF442 family)